MSTHIINFPGADIHTTTITSVSNVSVGENLDVTSNLTVSGNTALSSDLFVTGNVGIGTTEPTESLDIVGNLNLQKVSNTASIKLNSNIVMELPKHDRPLVKYPEVAMTSTSQDGYVISFSSADTNSSRTQYGAFDGIFDNSAGEGWQSLTRYSTSTGLPTGDADNATFTVAGTDYTGQWLKLKLPKKIRVESIIISAARSTTLDDRRPYEGAFLGSNDDTNWELIESFDTLGYVDVQSSQDSRATISGITNTSRYQYIMLVITKIATTNQYGPVQINELEYYGYEEGDTSVDVVHRSVPNKPGQQHLEVYWDANDSDSYSFADSSSVYDLSGSGVTGTLTNGVGFDTEYNAFTFDGVNDVVTAAVSNHSLKGGYSMATWINPLVMTDDDYIAVFGVGNTGTQIGINFDSLNALRAYIYGSSTLGIVAQTSDNYIRSGEWIHVVATYVSGTGAINLYINDKLAATGLGTSLTSISSSAPVIIGARDTNGTIERHANFKMANFRLFGKTLNADQVRELYEYDAPRFGHRQNLVSLHKGNLGVGVTEPSGQLELAGDERIQEYPPGPMSANESVVAGHGIFKARSSTSSTNLSRQPWNAFDDDLNYGWDSSQTNGEYSTSDGSYTAADGGSVTVLSGGGTYSGEFLEIELPYPIKLKTNYFYPQQNTTYGTPRFFREALVLGSNNGNTWDTLQSISETSYPYTYTSEEYLTVNTNSETYYKYFRVAANKVIGGTNGVRLNINEWKLFGTPGPTTLDKGSLSLTRSLDVPRISRYDVDTETPRPEKLLVDFDTTVNSLPTDISGKGNHGAFKNDSEYSAADKAFKFAAANAHIYLEQNTLSGTSATHTFSLWINALSGPGNGNYEAIFEAGVRTSNQAFGLYAYQDGSNTRVYYHVFGNNLPSNTTGYIVNTNSWYHICGTLDNSGNVRRFYVNGELFASDTYGSLNVTHPRIRIGENVDGSESWHGMVSNFKLYSVALEPSEVKKLYNLGRTGRSMVISDTAVGIGKVPEAQLDVRGSARFDGELDVRGSARFDGHLNVSSGNNSSSPASTINGWKTLTWSGGLVGNGTTSVTIFDRSGRGSGNGGEIAGEVTVICHRDGVNQTRAYAKYHVNYTHWYGTTFYGENNEYSNYNNNGISNIQMSASGGAGTVSVSIATTTGTTGKYYIKFDGPIYIP